jgi:DegV family protein with EDD domain
MEAGLIAIVTDSTCDISQAMVGEYGIIVIPQVIIWGSEQLRDQVDLTPLEFYRRLAVDPVRPTTSQAGVPVFLKAYQEAVRRGADEIICLTVSSAMSGTYQMALNAAEQVKTPVSVVDSKGPTMTLGWQVLAAARAVAAGMDLGAVLQRVAYVRERLVTFVAMDTMEYLKTGGRIGGAARWIGAQLQVKPLVQINHQTGLVEPVSLARTHKAVVEMMYTRFFDRLKGGRNLRIAVLHGNILAKAEELAERIQTEFHPLELLINITGPVLGINTGPGALALCGYTED